MYRRIYVDTVCTNFLPQAAIFSTIIIASSTPYPIINAKKARIMTTDKQQKARLMLQAIRDTEFLAPCEEIQNDFSAINADEPLTEKITEAIAYQLGD